MFVRTAHDDQVGLPGAASNDKLNKRLPLTDFVLRLQLRKVLAGG